MVEISGRAAYLQVADDLRAKIREGVYPVGSPLPSRAKLMEIYDVSIAVVRDALKELRGDGTTQGQQGKAVFVRKLPEAPEPSTTELAEVIRQISDLASTVEALVKRVAELEAKSQDPSR